MVSSLRYLGEKAHCTRVQSSQGWFGEEENKIIVKVFSKYQVQKTEISWELGLKTSDKRLFRVIPLSTNVTHENRVDVPYICFNRELSKY